MKDSLAKLNTELAPAKDQILRLGAVAVAGPALIWSGYKYPGTTRSRAALAGLGVMLIATNYSKFMEALQDGEKEPEESEEGRPLLG